MMEVNRKCCMLGRGLTRLHKRTKNIYIFQFVRESTSTEQMSTFSHKSCPSFFFFLHFYSSFSGSPFIFLPFVLSITDYRLKIAAGWAIQWKTYDPAADFAERLCITKWENKCLPTDCSQCSKRMLTSLYSLCRR